MVTSSIFSAILGSPTQSEYTSLQSFIFDNWSLDHLLTDATLPDFIDDLLLSYQSFLVAAPITAAQFWQIFTQDAIRFVTTHREESRADVMCYLKSFTFRYNNLEAISTINSQLA